MTIEARVPLNDVKAALKSYYNLYNCVHNPLYVYDCKIRAAKRTIISLLLSVVKIILFSVLIAVSASVSKAGGGDSILFVVLVILDIILGISIILDLFYLQRISGKRFGKLRFRYFYYVSCVVKDIRDLKLFKQYFEVKASVFALIFGSGRAEARKQITNWGYMVGEDYVNFINAYDQKYSNYRDYVDLSRHWGICDELLSIINSGRAVDVQSALNVVDAKRHREKMEQYARDEARAAAEMASAARETAAAASSVAVSAASTAATARSINSTLNDINSKL